jgi:hypothetical protein
MYFNGQGVDQDDMEAARWYKMAAEQGLANAQYNLGVMYAAAQGVDKDDKEAVRWYRAAAEQGHSDAGFNLAVMYATGHGVDMDYVQSYKWFSIAAAEGDQDSVKGIDRLTGRMTAEELAQAKSLAAGWKACKGDECEARVKQ